MAPQQQKQSYHPRKRFYRARAHSNPLSDSQFPVPLSPAHVDWASHFPAFFTNPGDSKKEQVSNASNKDEVSHQEGITLESIKEEHSQSVQVRQIGEKDELLIQSGRRALQQTCAKPTVRFGDIGCGFGGLLVKLSPMFPNTLMVGMELRDKVSEYVRERILALRKETGQFQNISIIRTNAMKYLQNYFQKGQLEKMFFLFPDPHFKERNHRRRVISVALLAEYAHVMAIGGILYTITDVQELGEWMKSCLDAQPLFEQVSLQEQEADPVVKFLKTATEEGQKVERNSGQTFQSVYRRVLPSNDDA